MKKLVVCLAAVGLAVGAQAAAVTWQSDTAAYGINATAVTDNGAYAAGTTVMKGKGTWNVILALYNGDTLVGQSASTQIKFSTTGNKFNTTFNVDGAEAGATYNYVLTLTGTQNDLTARGAEAAYDYTGASLTTTINGEITLATMGTTKFSSAVPSTWTVSGIQAVGGGGGGDGGVPEPTSGLLFLVGGALLGLRRKQK